MHRHRSRYVRVLLALAILFAGSAVGPVGTTGAQEPVDYLPESEGAWTGSLIISHGSSVADIDNTTEETTDDAEDTVDNTDDTVDESTDEAEETADEAGDTVDESTDEAEETADEAGDTVDETTDEAEDTADETSGEVTETSDETGDTADDTSEATTVAGDEGPGTPSDGTDDDSGETDEQEGDAPTATNHLFAGIDAETNHDQSENASFTVDGRTAITKAVGGPSTLANAADSPPIRSGDLSAGPSGWIPGFADGRAGPIRNTVSTLGTIDSAVTTDGLAGLDAMPPSRDGEPSIADLTTPAGEARSVGSMSSSSETDAAGTLSARPADPDLEGEEAVDRAAANRVVDPRPPDARIGPSKSGPTVPAGPIPPATGGAVAVGAVIAVTAAGRRLFATYPSMGGQMPNVRATASTGLQLTGEWWRSWKWRVFGLFGYQRYDDSDPLENERRAAIFAYLEDTPGAYLSEISDETDIPLPTVRYHLKILAHENLVSPAKMRGKRRFFPVGTEPSALDAALDDSGAAAVLEGLFAGGPQSVSGLANRLDRDPSTISYQLDKLAEDGLVVRERDGSAVVNRLPPEVRAAMAESPTSTPERPAVGAVGSD